MRGYTIVLLLLVGSAAFAESPNPAERALSVTPKSKSFLPPIEELIAPLSRSSVDKISTSVALAYDEFGNVYGVKLDTSTGDKDLDKAILSWAAKIKLQTDKPGVDSLPLSIDMGR